MSFTQCCMHLSHPLFHWILQQLCDHEETILYVMKKKTGSPKRTHLTSAEPRSKPKFSDPRRGTLQGSASSCGTFMPVNNTFAALALTVSEGVVTAHTQPRAPMHCALWLWTLSHTPNFTLLPSSFSLHLYPVCPLLSLGLHKPIWVMQLG